MECSVVTLLLGNYIDDELTSEMVVVVDQHIKSCKHCLAELTALRKTVEALAQTPPIEPASPWFAERLLRRAAQETETSLISHEQPAKNQQLGLF
jgi:anti-sigma factor RsiW